MKTYTKREKKRIHKKFIKEYPPINRWWSSNSSIYINNLLREIQRLDKQIRELNNQLAYTQK